MKEKILDWFANGSVGRSSKVMALCMADIKCCGESHPYDPDDFNRCLLFLHYVPEARQHMDKLRNISPTWNRLVDKWDEIEAEFLSEVGLNWSHGKRAPKTYELIKQARYEN